MSQAQPRNTGIGVIDYDLSEQRDNQLIRLRDAQWLVVESSPSEANLALGGRETIPINLVNYSQIPIAEYDEAYLSTPGTGSDTMRLVFSFEPGIQVDGDVTVKGFQVAEEDALPVDDQSTPTNATAVNTDSLTGDGSFGSQAIPDGFALFVKAETGNGDTAFVDGYPLAAGEETPPLHVDNFDVPAVTFGTQTDTVHAIAEAP